MKNNSITFVRAKTQLMKKIPIHIGRRQGDSLNPILSNLVMHEIVSEDKTRGRGYGMENTDI